MSVTAINCTPIKPQVAFGRNSDMTKEGCDQALLKAKDFSDQFVKSDDIKNPFQTVLSVAVAAGKSFIQGASTFLGFDMITKGGLSNTIKENGGKFVNNLDNFADKVAKSATANDTVGEIAGKLKKVPALKQHASNALKHISSAAKKVGAKYSLPVLAGIAAAMAIVPAICSRDNNGDGVKDIAQKSQSAYDKFENKSSKMLEGASQFAEIVSLLS